MADMKAAQPPRAGHHAQVDIAALRRVVQTRMAGREASYRAYSQSIQAMIDAIARGEPSVSPIGKRVRPKG